MKDKTVLFTLPGMDAVRVEHGETIDVYRPAEGEAPAAVVIVAGYRDEGFQRFVGCPFREMGWTTSWGRLIAASGLAAITYTNRDPAADAQTVVQHARERFGRVGLLASSGHAPLALWLMTQRAASCAALLYGYTFDVPEAARAFGFANPAEGMSVADLPADVPLFVARAGRDEMPGLNETLDRFVAGAIARNLPLTFMNHPDAPHVFDLLHDSAATRAIVRGCLGFLRQLCTPHPAFGHRAPSPREAGRGSAKRG